MKQTKFHLLKLILVIAGLSILLSGCYSSIELNNRAFVSLFIIDQNKNGIDLTLGFPLTTKLIPGQPPSGSGELAKNFTFVTQTGDTIEDAFQAIQSDVSRRITFRQAHNIIVGSEYAKKGIGEVLEFASRNPYMRLNNNIFMIEGNAREKLAQAPIFFERFPVTVLESYIENSNLLDVTVRDFLMSNSIGGDSLVPVLDFEKRNSLADPEIKPSLGTGRTAIFRKGKFIPPILGLDETRGALVALSQIKDFMVSVDSPTDKKKVGVIFQSLQTKIKPVFNNNKLTINMSTEGEANVISSDSNINLHDKNALNKLKQTLEELGINSTKNLMNKTQSVGADVLGIGDYVSAKYPKRWAKIEKDWRNYFKNEVDFNIQVLINIKRSGSTSQAVKDRFGLD
ncbi:Ger(x)C family spore germination protein [Paenibacillus turicensis]|uniref:Ger(x)C family spore germination protein n=1 Tax=Paenibacillus turicensis TaxID=160487 RepID=UPI003D2DBA12